MYTRIAFQLNLHDIIKFVKHLINSELIINTILVLKMHATGIWEWVFHDDLVYEF